MAKRSEVSNGNQWQHCEMYYDPYAQGTYNPGYMWQTPGEENKPSDRKDSGLKRDYYNIIKPALVPLSLLGFNKMQKGLIARF